MSALPPRLYPHRFGPYVIVCPIGVGSMGTVFGALMGTRGREKLCVIKKMNPEAFEVPNARERVHREGEIARQLSHGAIAQTFAVGEEEGAPYLVQEFVHGWSLNTLLADCVQYKLWPSIPLACHIVREVARGLAYVHTAGVVHRDIAPENIMVAYTGEVKVIDFGIAKVADEAPVTGTVVGRYTYGAPETLTHASLSVADARSDLYGLGVILWSLVAHRRDPHPFLRERRPTAQEEEATIEAPPSPSMFNPEVPLELDAVVMRALAYLPEDRYQTATELQAALGRYIPAGFVGEGEMKNFLLRHTDPTFARNYLKEMIELGKEMLPDAPPPVPSEPATRTPRLGARGAAGLAQSAPDAPGNAPRKPAEPLRLVLARAEAPPEPPTVFAAAALPEPLVFAGVIDAKTLPAAPRLTMPSDVPVRDDPASHNSVPRSRRIVYAAAALAAVVLGGGGVLLLTNPGPASHRSGSRPPGAHVGGRQELPPAAASVAPAPSEEPVSAPTSAAVEGPRPFAGESGATPKLRERVERRKVATRLTDASPSSSHQTHDATPATAAELLALAQSSLAQRHWSEAVDFGRRAVAAGAGTPGYLVIGNAFMKQDRIVDAERAFAEALRLEPGNQLALRRLRQAQERSPASGTATAPENKDP